MEWETQSQSQVEKLSKKESRLEQNAPISMMQQEHGIKPQMI